LIALKYFRPQELEGVMLSAAAKFGQTNSAEDGSKAIASDTMGQMKDLLAGLKHSSQERADAAVTVPEADLGPIPVSQPMAKDFQKFIETPGKLSIVVLEVPSDETSVKLKEMIGRVGRRFSNVAQVACFDLDTWPEVGEAEGVTQIPDVRFYRDGKKVDGFVGLPVKDVVLLEKFTRHSQGLAPAEPVATASTDSATPSAPAIRESTPLARNLTEPEFDGFIQRQDCLAVVAYCADWCPYSRELDQILATLGREFADVAEIGRVDVERVSKEFAARKNSKGVPVVALYRNGKRVVHHKGRPPLETLRKEFNEHTADLRAQREAAVRAQAVAPPARTSDEPAMQPMKKGWIPAGMEKR
jgi:thioredoxin-like negative regulator of GroEL